MNTEDIQKLALLARISISDDEATSLTKDMNTILGYIKQIETAEVEVGQKQIPLSNVVRDDVVVEVSSETIEIIKTNFPSQKNNYLEVNKILNND